MKNVRTPHMFALLAGAALLSACSGDAGSEQAADAAGEAATAVLENGMSVAEQIELRQEKLKGMGKAFKAISDQLRASEPDVAAIQAAAATVPELAAGMSDWFPDGTGPESGVETDALPVIWEDSADFQTKVGAMQTAAANLSSVAAAGDVAAIGAAFKETGGTCKNCHDTYRLED